MLKSDSHAPNRWINLAERTRVNLSERYSAEEAGLKAGDLIFQFDGKTVSDKRDLEKQLAQSPSGKKLPAKHIRNGQIKEVEIEIKSKEFPPLRRMVELGGVGQSLVIRDRSSAGIVYYDPETKNIVYVTVLPIGIVWKTVYSKEALDKDKYVGTMETTGIDGKKGTGQLHTEWMGKDEFSEWISFGNGDESLRITFQAG
jgi:membrane-associated protease RseP (regulator of RpoE activity)